MCFDPPSVRLGRWTRTHRVIATVLVLAVLAVTLVPGLVIANSLLQHQKQCAEENFQQFRAVVRQFVEFALDEPRFSLKEEFRRAILLAAKVHYERFLEENSGDSARWRVWRRSISR